LPVILLSSSVQQSETVRCRALGYSAYLTKPVQPSELFDAIAEALSTKSRGEKYVPPTVCAFIPVHNSMRILLAEDNPVNRKLAKTLLEKHGYIVAIAENGCQALEIIDREEVDLVLMDVQMPLMDGLQATRIIRTRELKSGTHLKIIALTAHAMKGDRERCLEAGADDYLTKPIRTADLLAAIDRAHSGTSATAAPSASLSHPMQENALDISAALERVEGDRQLLEELAALFAEESVKNIQGIREAFRAGDAFLLERLAHTIKGASSNIGAMSLSRAALALEEQARSRDLSKASERIAALEAEAERLRPELDLLQRNPVQEIRR
jgi:CheY-like chemotaxis protein